MIHCIALSLSLALGSASLRCSGVGTLVQLASDADLLTGTKYCMLFISLTMYYYVINASLSLTYLCLETMVGDC